MTAREKADAAASRARTAAQGFRVMLGNAIHYAGKAADEHGAHATAGELVTIRAAVELLKVAERSARGRAGLGGAS